MIINQRANVGIENVLVDNVAAYIQSWIKRLRNDKKVLIEAAGKAQKATKYILNESAGENINEVEHSEDLAA